MTEAVLPNEAALRRDARRERLALASLSLPALLLVLVVAVVPILWLFYLSCFADDGSLSLVNYRRLIEQPSYRRIYATTFEISAATTAISALLGYPLAYLLSQLPRRIAGMCMIGVLMPLWTSILVRTYAWLVLLQRHGVINDWGIRLGLWDEPVSLVYNAGATILGMVHIMLPLFVLPVYGSMRAIDPAYLKAASNLGAGPTRAFWLVFFPLSLPGMFAGAAIVFILSLGFYVTPAVLGGGKVIMVANRVAGDIEMFFNWGAASALGVVLLVLTGLILFAASRIVRLDRVLGGHGA